MSHVSLLVLYIWHYSE